MTDFISPETITERLSDLRAAMGKLDPDHTQAWLLEVYSPSGARIAVFDIKSGKRIRDRKPKQGVKTA